MCIALEKGRFIHSDKQSMGKAVLGMTSIRNSDISRILSVFSFQASSLPPDWFPSLGWGVAVSSRQAHIFSLETVEVDCPSCVRKHLDLSLFQGSGTCKKMAAPI